ncbi:MAG: hypothetical protein M1828_004399 [Chrysothrix sp. TS-e1954]|nr:MAG: hypothetical protein M1828_004399 [Chrysothrix sp. TS-e1954]
MSTKTSIELQPQPQPAARTSQVSLDNQSGADSQVAINPSVSQAQVNEEAGSPNDVSKTTTIIVITTVTGVTGGMFCLILCTGMERKKRPEQSYRVSYHSQAEDQSSTILALTRRIGVGTLLTGLLTVAIPSIARDVKLSDDLLLWPASIYALVCGCTLLISGSLSDVIGSRFTYLVGSFFQAVFSLACGLSQTGAQLIAFRACTGLAMSFCLPSATSLISTTLPSGRPRNVGFASMGGGQPLGFSLGLVLGGVFAQTIGWRWGFYLGAIFNLIFFAIAFFGLPKQSADSSALRGLKHKVDWVGACLATACLALLSYVFGAITTKASDIGEPQNIVMLVTAVALMPAFGWWMHTQAKRGKPVLIPNSVCGLEQVFTLYLQYVQLLSPIQTSLRFLPQAVSGVVAQITAGLLVHRLPAHYITTVGITLTLAPPLLLIYTKPSQMYWPMEFPAMVLQPFGADSLYTIANLVTTSQFSGELQGIAGGVFNTVSQIGKSIGLALASVVANTVTQRSRFEDKKSPEALFEGYRAAFWFCFALNVATLVLSLLGLRKIGKVGLKRD